MTLSVLVDGGWWEGIPKGSWGALVRSKDPPSTKVMSGIFSSCTSSGEAEILGVERVLAELSRIPRNSIVVVTTDYLRTVEEAKEEFSRNSKDTPEKRALKVLEKRISHMEKTRNILVILQHLSEADEYTQSIFPKAHDLAQGAIGDFVQSKTPPRKRKRSLRRRTEAERER